MSATALSLAAVAALAVVPAVARAAPARLTFDDVRKIAEDPRCGGAPPGSEFADRIVATILGEGGDRHAFADPFVIGVNEPGVRPVRSASATEAAGKARALVAAGKDIDLGLGQINVRQLARHGLSFETAFDPCLNVRAAAEHLAADYDAAWKAAHRRYNTGSTEPGRRGDAYAAGIEQVLARVRARRGVASPAPLVLQIAPPRPAEPPPCAPVWDAWALAECSARPVVVHARPLPGGPVPATGEAPAPPAVLTATAGTTDAADAP